MAENTKFIEVIAEKREEFDSFVDEIKEIFNADMASKDAKIKEKEETITTQAAENLELKGEIAELKKNLGAEMKKVDEAQKAIDEKNARIFELVGDVKELNRRIGAYDILLRAKST